MTQTPNIGLRRRSHQSTSGTGGGKTSDGCLRRPAGAAFATVLFVRFARKNDTDTDVNMGAI